MIEAILQDFRHGLRRLAHSPGFTAVAVLSVGLGIGANTTLFSFFNAIFLRPLPVRNPNEVVAVFTSDFSGPLYGGSSYPDYVDFRDKTEAFAGLAAYTVAPMSLREGSRTDRVFGELVTANYFTLAGIDAGRGRVFRPEEDEGRDAAPSIVVSDGFWRRRFGADPSVVGRPVTLNGQPFTVVGVAQHGFAGMMRGLAVDLWVPITNAGAIPSSDRLDRRGSRWLMLIGRLKSGTGVKEAEARLAVLASQLQKSDPQNWTDVRQRQRVVSVVPESQARIFPSVRGAVLGFFGLLVAVVGLVLLMACVNVAGLLLARAAARSRETAIRLSLGASRGRLIQQLLTESVVVSLLAGAVGILVARWASDLLMAFRPPLPVPVELDLRFDVQVFAFTVLVAVLTGLASGLVPALQATRAEPLPALKGGPSGSGHALSGWSPRRLLIVAQMALSLVLLVGAGLFLKSLRNAHRIDPGFETTNLLLVSLDLGLNGYDEPRGRQLYGQLLERAGGLPGVRSVSLATSLPLGLGASRRNVSIEGYQPAPGEDMEVHTNSVGPDYFRTMGIRRTRGRDFTAADTSGAPGVVAVNESFARRYWPGQDPIGKHLTQPSPRGPQEMEVVGVLADGKYVTLGEEPTPFYYVPFLQRYESDATLHVRTAGDPKPLAASLREQVQALDPSLPVFDVKTMTDHMGVSLLPARVAGSVLGAFGFVALALAAMGIYGVMAQLVRQRTREMGVRVALGARPADLLSMVIGQGMRVVAIGLGLGLLAAFPLARLATSLLYGTSPADPTTFIVIPTLLAGVALLASYLPARWATKVDPVVALRHE